MKNPFRHTGIATAPAFCNRETESSELLRAIENARNILLYSHRRTGKTSLIQKVLGGLSDVHPFYVDLYGTTTVEEFVTATIRALTREMPSVEHALTWLRMRFTRLTFQFSADPATGQPTVTPAFTGHDEEEMLTELFRTLEELSYKKPLVVAFDDFQETTSYGAPYFEKRIRLEIQSHHRVSYIFSGNHPQLITPIFTDRKRPLYNLAAPLPLTKIDTEAWVTWAMALFKHGKRAMDENVLQEVITLCQGHPMYIQEFFYHLWENGLPDGGVGEILQIILQRREMEFINLFSTMTPNQKRAMKLVARHEGKGLFSAKNLQSVGFTSTSQASRALGALLGRDDVIKEESWSVCDPLFKQWILRLA